jgi:hypothetical protein
MSWAGEGFSSGTPFTTMATKTRTLMAIKKMVTRGGPALKKDWGSCSAGPAMVLPGAVQFGQGTPGPASSRPHVGQGNLLAEESIRNAPAAAATRRTRAASNALPEGKQRLSHLPTAV